MAALLAGLIGCGGGQQVDADRATVAGIVTLNGEPLPAGTIMFKLAEGHLGTPTKIREGGRYTTNRAPIGRNLVSIDTESVKFGNPAKHVPIPEEYWDAATSGLTADVTAGENDDVDFALTK